MSGKGEPMTKGEALKKMQAVKTYMTSGNPIWDVTEIGEAFGMAIEALEQQEQHWIPCSERLPDDVEIGEEYPTVIFCTAEGTVHVGGYEHYLGGKWWYMETWEDEAKGVIAWMPLPEPYEMEVET